MKFIITLSAVLILLTSPVCAQTARLLTGEDYFHTAHKLISEAKKTVDIYMYFIIIDEDDTENPVNVLVSDLIAAKKRGVDTAVFLEDKKLNQNKAAYQELMQNGVNVAFDTPGSLLHTKTIVIDDRFCIIGSTNWTRAAIETNYETAVLVDSEDLARGIKKYFSKMEISVKPEMFSGIFVPYEFLLNPKYGPAMFEDHAQNALDLYLFLLKGSQRTCSNVVKFNYGDIVSELGCRGGGRRDNETEYYYLRIRKPFQALKSRYNLIDYDTLREKKIIMRPIESTQIFVVPFTYWDYGYSKSLSFKAKYMYLISLLETSKNKDYPFWFRSNESISSVYNISTNPVSLGFLELERENIIEITRSKAEDRKYEDRQANIYKVNPLMSKEEFSSRIDELKKKNREDTVRQALYLADFLDEPKDIDKIRILIGLLQSHGYPEVAEAVSRAGKYKKGTGLHSIETVLTLLGTEKTEVE